MKSGVAAMGLSFAAQEGHQLWQLNTITVPEGVDEAAVRKRLLNDFDIEIGAGLGPLKREVRCHGPGHSVTCYDVSL